MNGPVVVDAIAVDNIDKELLDMLFMKSVEKDVQVASM